MLNIVRVAAFATLLAVVAESRLLAQGPAASPPDDGAVVLRHRQAVRFESDGRRSTTMEVEVHVTSPAGLDTWSSLDMWFAAERETATLVSLVIVKPSGERIRPSNLSTEDRRASGVFDAATVGDLTARHVTVPSLAVGDRLAYQYEITGRVADLEGGFATALQFPTDAVVREALLEADLPLQPTARVWSRPGGLAPEEDTVAGGRRRLRWRRGEYRPASEPELTFEAAMNAPKDQPDPDVIISSFGTWHAVGQWYAGVLGGVRFERSPLAARARELTASSATQEDRLRALYQYVARDIRYVSLAFGLGRYQPRSPVLVLETGYGDCKDKHLLLAALAREVGIVLDAVLIGSTDTLAADAPSPSQFDHLISVWRRSPDPSSWLWLDSTSGLTKAGVLLPHLRDKLALLIDTAGGHTTVTTAIDQARDVMRVTATGALAADGAQTVTVSRRLEGDRATLYRMLGAEQWTPEQARAAAKELLDSDGLKSSTVTAASFTSGDDPWGPLDATYTATVKYSLASSIDKKTLWVSTPSFDLPDPEKIGTPWRLPLEPGGLASLAMTYTLPEGWQVDPPVDMTLTQPFGRYRSRYSADGRVLKIERVLEYESATVENDARPTYALFRKSVQDDRTQQVGLRIAAAAPSPGGRATDDLYEEARRASESGQFERERDLLVKLTTERPDHPRAWIDLGRAYVRASQLALAQQAFERHITLDPLSTYAYNHLGMVLSTQRRPVEAEAAFRKQIEISPLDKLAHRNLGALLLEARRLPEAVAALETAVSVDRQDAYSRVQLGRAYLALEANAKALDAFEAATSAAPPSPLIFNEAAWWLVEHDVNLPLARTYAERGLAAASGSVGVATSAQMRSWRLTPMAMLVRIWDTLGWIAFKQGDLASATLWLEAAYAFSDASEVAWHTGLLRERQGRKAAALVAYGRAAASPRRSQDAALAAVQRLERQGLSVPGGVGAADLKSRQSSIRVAGVSVLQRGELLVNIEPSGGVGEVVPMSGEVPAALVAALKGQQIPGSEVARERHLRLFRSGSAECTALGHCTIVWHRLP